MIEWSIALLLEVIVVLNIFSILFKAFLSDLYYLFLFDCFSSSICLLPLYICFVHRLTLSISFSFSAYHILTHPVSRTVPIIIFTLLNSPRLLSATFLSTSSIFHTPFCPHFVLHFFFPWWRNKWNLNFN